MKAKGPTRESDKDVAICRYVAAETLMTRVLKVLEGQLSFAFPMAPVRDGGCC